MTDERKKRFLNKLENFIEETGEIDGLSKIDYIPDTDEAFVYFSGREDCLKFTRISLSNSDSKMQITIDVTKGLHEIIEGLS